MNTTRRNFLKGIVVATGAAVSVPEFAGVAKIASEKKSYIKYAMVVDEKTFQPGIGVMTQNRDLINETTETKVIDFIPMDEHPALVNKAMSGNFEYPLNQWIALT